MKKKSVTSRGQSNPTISISEVSLVSWKVPGAVGGVKLEVISQPGSDLEVLAQGSKKLDQDLPGEENPGNTLKGPYHAIIPKACLRRSDGKRRSLGAETPHLGP